MGLIRRGPRVGFALSVLLFTAMSLLVVPSTSKESSSSNSNDFNPDDISRVLKHKLGQITMAARKGNVELATETIDRTVDLLTRWKQALQATETVRKTPGTVIEEKKSEADATPRITQLKVGTKL